MSYNIFSALRDELTGNAEYVEPNTFDTRLKTCLSCEFLLDTGIAGGTCKKCGCFVAIKTRYKKSSCPIGKWKEIM